jgi:lysozyme family protein
LNRVLDSLGVAKIGVDGAIGPGTLAALQTIGAQAASASSYGLTNVNHTCANVAANVQRLTVGAQGLADFLNVPSSVSSPSPDSTPSYVNLATGQLQTQAVGASAMDAFNNLSTTQKLALGAGLAVAGFYAMRGKKRKTNRTSRRY